MEIEIHDGFSGVVHVTEAGHEVFSSGFGFANRAEQIPNTIATRFVNASGTKTFVAIAVARLVDDGHFDFDTPLTEILEAWPSGFDPEVTVHHLLSHTSGIPDYFDEEIEDDFEALWATLPMYKVRTPSDLLPLFVDRPTKFTPGDRFSYCNSGFVMLGLLIEQHTGISFTDFVAANVFERAGMSESGFFPTDRLPPRAALNYLTDEDADNPRINIFTVPVNPMPDGGAFVTAPDMVSFWTALADRRLLSEETSDRVLKRHSKTRDTGGYGYGIWIDDVWGEGQVFHAEGGDPGLNFVSGFHGGRDLTVTVISNTDGGVGKIYRSVFDQLL